MSFLTQDKKAMEQAKKDLSKVLQGLPLGKPKKEDFGIKWFK